VTRRISLSGSVLAIGLLLAVSVGLQMMRDARFALPTSEDESVYVSRRAVGRLAFAFRPLLADIYWIRSIQYYGGHRRQIVAQQALEPPPLLARERPGALTYDQLYTLLDITTSLDPRFNIAYRFGAIFLAESYPQGAGRPDQAIALLEKGVDAMPERWEYLEDTGFVYYWDLHDYAAAARYFNRAADLPGAPWWLRGVAAATLARGGDRSSSRLLWRHIYDTATDDRQRQAAAVKLLQLDALDRIDQLQLLVDRYSSARRETARSWQPLIAAGVLRNVPFDPSGTPFELDEGRVTVSGRSPLFPLPVEPAARGETP
jgi:tetratricopeptide (TPR) repeat protein